MQCSSGHTTHVRHTMHQNEANMSVNKSTALYENPNTLHASTYRKIVRVICDIQSLHYLGSLVMLVGKLQDLILM